MINLKRTDIFMVLNFLTQEQDGSLHTFRFSLVSFKNVFQCSVYESLVFERLLFTALVLCATHASCLGFQALDFISSTHRVYQATPGFFLPVPYTQKLKAASWGNYRANLLVTTANRSLSLLGVQCCTYFIFFFFFFQVQE